MGIMGRYILRQVLTVFVLVLATLTAVLWLTQLLERVNLLTTEGQTFALFLTFTLLSLPGLLIVVAPIALFIACIYVLNRLNGDSELIVISASGASRWVVIKPIMTAAVFTTILMFVASLYLVPLSWRTLRILITEIRSDVLADIVQPGTFSSPESGLVFHVRDRSSDGTLLGLLVQDERNDDISFTYLAEAARLVADETTVVLVMQSGSVQQVTHNGQPKGAISGPDGLTAASDINIVEFDRYLLDLSQFADDRELQLPSLKPRERDMRGLFSPEPDDPRYLRSPGKFRSEINQRLTAPLYPLVFAAIALAAVGFARSNREKRFMGVMIAITAVLIVRIFGFSSVNLSARIPAIGVLVYAVPLATLAVALAIASGKMRFTTAATRLAAVNDRIADLTQETLRRGLGVRRAS